MTRNSECGVTDLNKRLIIDASNIRGGGGLTHLQNFIGNINIEGTLFSEIVLFSSQNTLKTIEGGPVIKKISHPLLNRSGFSITLWKLFILPREIKKQSKDNTVVFSPSGTLLCTQAPTVNMCQNMLLHDSAERMSFDYLSWLRWKLEILSIIQKMAFNRSAGIIFISHHAKVKVGSKFTAANTVAYHGISKKFYRSVREQVSMSVYSHEKPFKLLYVSSLYPYKHHMSVLAAINRLRTVGYPIELTIVGDSKLQPNSQIKRHIETLSQQRSEIKYLGEVPFDAIDKIYSLADGFIFASSCENMPNILLEAMTSGLPICCSSSEPMPEFMPTDHEFFFDPYDDISIEVCLRCFLETPENRESSAKKTQQASIKFTWKECSQITMKFLESF